MSGRIAPETIRRAIDRAIDPTRARIEPCLVDGAVFHRIVLGDGSNASRELLERWTDEPDPRRSGAPPRRLEIVVLDESPLVGGDLKGWRFDPASLELGVAAPWREFGGLPLTLLDTNHVVGICDDVALAAPGAVRGTEGSALIAHARMLDTVLATIAWDAVRRRVFDGVCVVSDGRMTTWDRASMTMRGGQPGQLIVGDLASSCCANARILRTWEGSA